MTTRTYAQLETEARQRADMVNDSGFITSSEAQRYIDVASHALWDLLIECEAQEYLPVSSATLTVSTTTGLAALPTDFYRLMGIDCTIGGITYTLEPFNFFERNRYNTAISSTKDSLAYRLLGTNVQLIPLPTSGGTYKIWYLAEYVPAGEADPIWFGGWEEYVVVDTAIQMLTKEESDTSALQLRKMEIVERIRSAAMNRDMGSPSTVTDTSGGW